MMYKISLCSSRVMLSSCVIMFTWGDYMLNEKIKKARMAKGMMQKDLATALNVRPSTVSMWEAGTRTPDLQMTAKIAETLGVSADYLLDIDTKKAPQASLQGFTQDEFNKVMSESEWHQYLAEMIPENRSRLKDYAELLLLSQGQADQEEK